MRILVQLVAAAALLCAAAGWAAEPVAVEGTVDAPVAQVWSAFATSDGLQSWLAPHADIELRIGGAMRSNYDPKGVLGDGGTIVNQVLAFEPARMLAMRVAKAPDAFPFPNAVQAMWTVIYLDPATADRTRLRVVSLGFGDDDESQRMRAFFERGNAATLQQLQQRFAHSGATSR